MVNPGTRNVGYRAPMTLAVFGCALFPEGLDLGKLVLS